ncbi:MAG: hypothetical protein OXB89_05370, partial [Anaerolineaceae bacterium]|nr:hypothetical protein [Anaerolineaceae bacterium]
MKREALVARNRRLSAARHRPSPRQRLRRLLLAAASRFPFVPAPTGDRQRIVLLRPDHLGDALLTLPAIDALRVSYPDAEIKALASPAATSILGRLPALSGVETQEFPGFNRAGRSPTASPWRQAMQASRNLRRQQSSAGVVLPPHHWW